MSPADDLFLNLTIKRIIKTSKTYLEKRIWFAKNFKKIVKEQSLKS